MSTFFLVTALLFNALANILMKYASTLTTPALNTPLLQRLTGMYLSWPFLIGLFAFGLNLVFYTQALKTLPISIAYPVMTGAGFVFIAVSGIYLFSEKLQPAQMIGIGLVFAGILMISHTA